MWPQGDIIIVARHADLFVLTFSRNRVKGITGAVGAAEHVGAWRSWLACLTGGQEVVSSSLTAPTFPPPCKSNNHSPIEN